MNGEYLELVEEIVNELHQQMFVDQILFFPIHVLPIKHEIKIKDK